MITAIVNVTEELFSYEVLAVGRIVAWSCLDPGGVSSKRILILRKEYTLDKMLEVHRERKLLQNNDFSKKKNAKLIALNFYSSSSVLYPMNEQQFVEWTFFFLKFGIASGTGTRRVDNTRRNLHYLESALCSIKNKAIFFYVVRFQIENVAKGMSMQRRLIKLMILIIIIDYRFLSW